MIHNRQIGWTTGLLIVCLGGVAALLYMQAPTYVQAPAPQEPVVAMPKLLSTYTYLCDREQKITAEFFEQDTPVSTTTVSDAPPIPTGFVTLNFDGVASKTLQQTLSADGARYATADESLVVWSKGQSLMVLQDDAETDFTGCLAVAPDPGTLPQMYGSSSLGITVRYPAGFTLRELPREVGTTTIPGIAIQIATATASGTNLSSDSYVSVESVELAEGVCTVDQFVDLAAGQATSTVVANDVSYSFSSSSEAGAGNRYDEYVFVRSGTEVCSAVRYVIHYTVLENYDPGTVQAFDRESLLAIFDSIRDTTIRK